MCDDHRALKAYIEILYMEHLRTRLSGTDACLLSSAPVAAYSRKHLTQQLAHILDSLAQPITRLEPPRYASEEKMNRRYALIKTCTTRFR